MVKSLQDILRRRQQEEFVGREEQLAFFRHNLRYAPDDDRRRFVIGISGQGGVGKTWLLRRFCKIAGESGAVTVCTDEAEEDIPSVLGHIAKQFKIQGLPLETFVERYKVYRQRCQEIEADPEAPQGFPVFLGRALAKGGLQMARRVPVGGVVADFVDEEAFATLAGDLSTYVARKIRNKDEVRLVMEPVKVLTPLFLSDLQETAEKLPISLFFDTYERTGGFLDSWLREVLEGRHGDVPVDILLVVAGRDELDRNHWAAYEGLLARLPLESFTEEEAVDYLARKGITDERVVEVIVGLSGRLPLLMAILAAESPDDPEKIGDPSGEALERFLKWVEDPKQRQVALDAALPRLLNRDVLAVLVGEEEAEALFAWLSKAPFVVRRGDGWAYHDEVRMQMLRHKRQESPEGWANLHHRLAMYYDGLCGSLELKEVSGRKDETWQRYAIESLYHRLCQAPRGQLAGALNGFLAALTAHSSFAHRWAEVIEYAGEDSRAETVQKWGQRLEKLLNAYDEEDYLQVSEGFTTLLEQADVEDRWRAVALSRRARVYNSLRQYNEALDDLNKAIQLTPDDALVIAIRGATYRKMKRHEKALIDFNHAVGLNPGSTWAVWYRGETYRSMRYYDEALADFNRAIEQDPGDVSHISVRGVLYLQMRRYEDALADFNQAIQLEPSLAWAISGRGEALQGTEQYDQALIDFGRAIELNSRNARSYVGRGMTYLLQGHCDNALIDFNKAIKRSRRDEDRYLYRRALAYCKRDQTDKAQEDVAAAIKIARERRKKNPKDWRNILRLALYHLVAGETDEAEALYRVTLSGKAPAYRACTVAVDLKELLTLFPDHDGAKVMQDLLHEYLSKAEQ